MRVVECPVVDAIVAWVGIGTGVSRKNSVHPDSMVSIRIAAITAVKGLDRRGMLVARIGDSRVCWPDITIISSSSVKQ